MHRLLVPSALLAQECVVLPSEAAQHLKVVRPKKGESVELFDGAGCSRIYSFDGAGPLRASGACVHAPARRHTLTLFACVTKGSRWDWTIEKAVELGAMRLVPVLSARVIVRLESSEYEAKRMRWQRIAQEAARQSDACYVPQVALPVSFAHACEEMLSCSHVFVGALVQPPAPSLLESALKAHKEAGDKPLSFGLFVGPEGDFTPEELSTLLTRAIPTSFGPTILRAETASLYGLTILSAVLN